jgi:hypothetical protein
MSTQNLHSQLSERLRIVAAAMSQLSPDADHYEERLNALIAEIESIRMWMLQLARH